MTRVAPVPAITYSVAFGARECVAGEYKSHGAYTFASFSLMATKFAKKVGRDLTFAV